jgi:uncharacterized BrkB/YihY/UPF0761 family membrane protein
MTISTPTLPPLVRAGRRLHADGGAQLAAAVAFYGLLAVFPLLSLGTGVLTLAMGGFPGLRRAVARSVSEQLPGLAGHVGAGLPDGGISLAAGVGGALLAGTGSAAALQSAFDTIHRVPERHRPGFVAVRVKGAALLTLLGALQVVAGGASLVLASHGVATGPLVMLVPNVLTFAVAFRVLSPATLTPRELAPGVLLAAGGWTVLQALGTGIVHAATRHAGVAPGVFASLVGLVSWVWLGARLMLLAAAVNAVLHERSTTTASSKNM